MNTTHAEVSEGFDVEASVGQGLRPSEPCVSGQDLEDDERSDEGTYWADRAEQQAEGADEDEGWDGEDDWEDVEDDLRRQVDEFAEDESNIDEDAPSDKAETGQKTKKPGYQFCPPAHRLSILRLFAKHASQHSLLPERHGEKRTKDDIRRDAVEEMYRHCEVNHLCEVWAYLWNSWYSRKRWPLWARGAYSASIPCKRTTMMVEALWRNLKRLVLHMYNRPPVDLAVHAIITKALPPY
ncbi:uncharacterized protein B0H18DRAFT_877978, partial [Fomitopsis serialis]|uniref:uncharacterized protein n=1 Tax=Fomitopsis serialis TaxID=139415 RepID=UPI002007AB08